MSKKGKTLISINSIKNNNFLLDFCVKQFLYCVINYVLAQLPHLQRFGQRRPQLFQYLFYNNRKYFCCQCNYFGISYHLGGLNETFYRRSRFSTFDMSSVDQDSPSYIAIPNILDAVSLTKVIHIFSPL
jgi:hypothetical protein